MSNIDKRALREIAEAAVGAHERLSVMPPDDIFDISLAEGTQLDADITALNALNSAANPATVLALLDELEAAEKRIAELEARQVLLPPKAPDNLASCLDGYEKWLIATTFRDTWNACLAEVVRVNAAAGKGE
jgi:hypothetical protein